MRHPIKLIVKKGKVRNDGTSLIFLQYCHSGDQRVLMSTGVSIPPNYWNRRTGRISKELPSIYGDVESLEKALTEKLRKAEDMVSHSLKQGSGCPMQFLKSNFKLSDNWKIEQMQDSEKSLDVLYNIDQYVKSKESSVKKCTINVINAMKAHLQSFQAYRKQPITFESFDAHFYENFVRYLTYEISQMRRSTVIKGLKVNTIGKTIKHLKSFLKDRMRKKIIPFQDLTAFKVMEEEVDAVYLTWEELALIYHLDLSSHAYLEKYRNLFVLGCLTGFRFSDYSDIKPEEVRGGMLYVNQAKTLSTVVVPLRPDAKKILIDKYRMLMPQVSNPNFNYYIKEVVRLAGIEDR
jgi:hypothetical protein